MAKTFIKQKDEKPVKLIGRTHDISGASPGTGVPCHRNQVKFKQYSKTEGRNLPRGVREEK